MLGTFLLSNSENVQCNEKKKCNDIEKKNIKIQCLMSRKCRIRVNNLNGILYTC